MNERPDRGTDFLGRLVNRARGDDDGLQPRLPSLFEPSRFSGIGIADGQEPAGPADEAAGDSLQPAYRDGGMQLRHAAGVPELRHDQIAARSRQQQEPSQYPATAAEPAPTVSFATRSARLRTQPTVAALVAPDDRAAALPPKIIRAALFDAGDESRPAGARVPAAATGDETAPGDRRPLQNGVLTPSFDRNAHSAVAEPQATRRPTPQQSRLENLVAGAQPVVNVTIGRVEVRAMQIPPAPRRASAQGLRPMSLDDYLKRRGGGR